MNRMLLSIAAAVAVLAGAALPPAAAAAPVSDVAVPFYSPVDALEALYRLKAEAVAPH